jgi:hypothetical protein
MTFSLAHDCGHHNIQESIQLPQNLVSAICGARTLDFAKVESEAVASAEVGQVNPVVWVQAMTAGPVETRRPLTGDGERIAGTEGAG